MKILVVHNGYRIPGGDQVAVEQECQLLRAAGHDVITYKRSNAETEAYTGISQVVVVKQMVWAGDVRQDVFDLLRRENPDIVHVHNTFMVISPSIYYACHDAGVPVVLSLHDYRLFCPAGFFYRDGHPCEECVDRSRLQGVIHGCYRQSRAATAAVALMLSVHHALGTWIDKVDRFIALTEFARQKFVRSGLPAEMVSVKPNFIYSPPGWSSDDENAYAIYVGRLSPEKGVDILLNAWAKLRTSIPLLLVGEGPSLADLQMQAERLALQNVTFTGRLPWDKTIEAMRKSRFLLFPSLSYEGFPMTIVEALACGKPVICSSLGSMPEIVLDGNTGLCFEPGNVDDLADKIGSALANPEKMRHMGEEARRTYEREYSPEKNYALLMGIYQRAIREHRKRSKENKGLPTSAAAE